MLLLSSPGRIRTVDPLFVRQVPSPLGHRTVVCFHGAEAVGLEPTSLSTGGFQNRFLTNSGDLRLAPGTGIEPATFWFRARRNYQQLLPRINKRPASESNADKRGSKPHRCTSSRGVRAEGIEPIVLWLEARHSAIELRTQFQAEGARVELARQYQCSAAFEAAAITNWLALPSSAPAAGIEPA